MIWLSRGPDWDSNPGSADLESAVLNRSTTGPHKWREEDLNLRPSVYETDELPDCYHLAIGFWEIRTHKISCDRLLTYQLVEETKILYNK